MERLSPDSTIPLIDSSLVLDDAIISKNPSYHEVKIAGIKIVETGGNPVKKFILTVDGGIHTWDSAPTDVDELIKYEEELQKALNKTG